MQNDANQELKLPLFGVDGFPAVDDAPELALLLLVSAWFFLGTGELLPEGVALFPGPSSPDEVVNPDSSSEDIGWSPPACVDCKKVHHFYYHRSNTSDLCSD